MTNKNDLPSGDANERILVYIAVVLLLMIGLGLFQCALWIAAYYSLLGAS